MIKIYNGIKITGDITISPFSTGFSYGEGFFTTIKVVDGNPENLDFHKKRIRESYGFFSFNNPPDIDKIINKINFETKSYKLKITFFKDLNRVSYLAVADTLPERMNEIVLKISSSFRGDDPIFKIKSLNYYSNLKNRDSIILDYKKRVLETGFANIFILKSGKILTPPESLPLLKGSFRDHLIKRGTLGGYPIFEEEFNIDELLSCDGVFITNALRGIVPVVKVDKTIFDGSIIKNLLNS